MEASSADGEVPPLANMEKVGGVWRPKANESPPTEAALWSADRRILMN